jgi:osmotically-inducible protein OsmY
MKNDSELQRDVLDQLRREPGLDASRIGVAANCGVVRLTGVVGSDAESSAAEEAVWYVYGVDAVVRNIEVRPPLRTRGVDRAIAEELKIVPW